MGSSMFKKNRNTAFLCFVCAFWLPVTGFSKTTPSDVYAQLDFAEQHLDAAIANKNLKMQKQSYIESNLKPMHAYQMIMAGSDMVRELQIKNRISPFPIMSVAPMKYTPAAVLLLTNILEQEIKRTFAGQGVTTDSVKLSFYKKTPTDVFNKAMDIFIKLRLLSGKTKISPNFAYAQMARGVSDAVYILVNIDENSRYKIDAPISAKSLGPTDVFKKAIEVRKTLNTVRQFFRLPESSIPNFDGNKKTPQDVYYQTQIIIAELNIIKVATKTMDATPVAIHVDGKKPSDVHQLVADLDYLIKQTSTLTNIVNSEAVR